MGRMFKGDNCLGGIPTALAPPLVASAKPGKKGIFVLCTPTSVVIVAVSAVTIIMQRKNAVNSVGKRRPTSE
jgi:hypothetical protein